MFGKKDSPASAPAPKPAPAQPVGQPKASAQKPDASPAVKTYKPKARQRTVFTGALGLSEAQKSGISLKKLTGR